MSNDKIDQLKQFAAKDLEQTKAKAWQFITVRLRPLTEVRDELRLPLWLIVQGKS